MRGLACRDRLDQLVLLVWQRQRRLVDSLGSVHVGEHDRGAGLLGRGDGRVEIGLPLPAG